MKKYTKQFSVQKKDIDVNGHVSNIRYLEWFIESAVAHSDALGVGFEILNKENRTWVAKEHHIIYKMGAFEGDKLEIRTWVESVKTAQSVRKYEITNLNTNKVVCEGWTNWVYVELSSLRPQKIPQPLIEKYLKE